MYWFRVLFMCGTLAVVLWAMYWLNSGKRPSLSAPGAKVVYHVGDAQNMVICPTRVTAMELADGTRIYQEQMKWLRQDRGGKPVELNAIAVEKWFGANCMVHMREGDGPATEFQPVLRLGLVSGQSEIIEQARNGDFRMKGHQFTSPQLTEALRQLPALPAATSPGQP
jgi:hypothetical protein